MIYKHIPVQNEGILKQQQHQQLSHVYVKYQTQRGLSLFKDKEKNIEVKISKKKRTKKFFVS